MGRLLLVLPCLHRLAFAELLLRLRQLLGRLIELRFHRHRCECLSLVQCRLCCLIRQRRLGECLGGILQLLLGLGHIRRVHRLAFRLHRFAFCGFVELFDRLLLLGHGSGQVALLEGLRGSFGVLGRFRLIQLRSLIGDLLLQFCQVRFHRGGVGLHRVHRLTEWLGRLVRLLGGFVRLLDRLRQLLSRVGGVDLVRLQCRLIGDFLRLQFVGFLIECGLSFFEFLRGFGALFAGGHRLVVL